MRENPCVNCGKRCPYRLFIDCPTWEAWAAEKNSEMEEEDQDE